MKIYVYLDESGSIHKNSNTRYFAIGGYFCLEQDKMKIKAKYKRENLKLKKVKNISLDKEIKIIKEYLPEPLSESEVNEIIEKAMKEVEASTLRDMGKVMKIITPLVKGRCDMKEVSNKIKAKLS